MTMLTFTREEIVGWDETSSTVIHADLLAFHELLELCGKLCELEGYGGHVRVKAICDKVRELRGEAEPKQEPTP